MSQYFIGHKPFALPQGVAAIPIQVGFQESFCGLRDSTGDSISEKNGSFCELTALYWIWKNDKESQVVGINHYRRWFRILSKEGQAETLLKSCDILVPKFEPYKESVYEQYCLESGFAKDLDLTRQILEAQHPEDVWAFDQVMKQGGLFQYNMMICSKKQFDAYCAWLFPLLFELERHVNLEGYNDYQKRIYGFLSERLLNVWIAARHLKARELPVVQSEMDTKEKGRLCLRRLKNRIQFSLSQKKEGVHEQNR